MIDILLKLSFFLELESQDFKKSNRYNFKKDMKKLVRYRILVTLCKINRNYGQDIKVGYVL